MPAIAGACELVKHRKKERETKAMDSGRSLLYTVLWGCPPRERTSFRK